MKIVNILLTIVLMAVLGALIGGITNFIAIKMLFRPYKAVYIGKWRLPFTPGLIPKRRDELSTQLGRTIVQYLLTPETFKKRFFNEEMRNKLEGWLYRELKTYVFESHRSLNGWLEIAGQQNLDVRIESKLDELVDRQALALRAYIEGKTIGELLPENWKEETEQKMIHGVKYAIDQGSDYFASLEGRQTVKNFFDEFLESRGRFGHMLHSLLGESKPIVDRIQPEIIKFLNSPRTFELAITLAYGEWEKLQDRRADDLLKEFDFEPAVGAVKQYVREIANIDGRLDRTLAETWPTGLEWTSANIIPLVTDFVFEQGEVKLEDTLHKIDIQGMVKEQVDSLPLSRLEELVLGISQRELKMITALGFFLGGFIGVFQGIISIVLNNA
ncbi:DUF445 domain-containing protein [Planococcus chinensis]|uniref:DUF445 domain-containing protein n=1 Tax=Planococcus chinensis TaxID=272917 RepID=UPI00295E3508|nr:DUF445 family protein [Planococcus chinensis]